MSTAPESAAAVAPPAAAAAADEARARKQELRKLVRSRLKAATQDDIAAESGRVWENLFRLPEYKSARSVALFLSMPRGEIVTDTALARVLDDGKTLYVPRVGMDFEKCDMDMIKVHVSHDTAEDIAHSKAKAHRLFYHDWPRNRWGIPEPPPEIDHESARPGDIDLIVVPGLAFDGSGGRLGQGKGYYDRFIAKMRGGAPGKGEAEPILVAVGLGASFVEGEGPQVPMSEHDYPMDMLVLPTGAISISKGRER